MTEAEFDQQASAIAAELDSRPLWDRIAGASRGSGNPQALRWLADRLGIDDSCRVVDLGAGLGGPAAWLASQYEATVVLLEPAQGATRGAEVLFGMSAVRGDAANPPFRDASFDVALLLGVVSCTESASDVLHESGRLATRLGVMDYCAASPRAVSAGGSRFPPSEELLATLARSGWHVEQFERLSSAAPQRWVESAAATMQRAQSTLRAEDVEAADAAAAAQREVSGAIDTGQIVPIVLTARRVGHDEPR